MGKEVKEDRMDDDQNGFTGGSTRCAALLRGAVAAFIICAGCGPPDPVLQYSLETPPLILAPTGLAGVADGRGRFREIYCAVQEDHGDRFDHNRPCDETLHRLSGEPAATGKPVHLGGARIDMRILVVPGTMSECVKDILSPLPYARAHLEEHGYKTDLLMVGGRSSSTYNATQIRDYLLAMEAVPSEIIVLIGFSKGTTDALEAVANHPEAAQRVAAVVGFAGVVSGSPLADNLPGFQEELFKQFTLPACEEGDRGAVESLRRSTRVAWLAEHRLPDSVRYFSVAALAERENISAMARGSYDTLAMIDPRNDGQVIFFDAIIPGSTLLGYANADHWAIALPITRDMPTVSKTLISRNEFPREIFLEAIVRFVEEALLESP